MRHCVILPYFLAQKQALVNSFLATAMQNTSMPTTNVTNFYNVIAQSGADPWIYKHTDGYYYMTRTTGGDVRIWRSRTFTSFDASDSISIWRSPGSGPACRDVWAPEIHLVNSAW